MITRQEIRAALEFAVAVAGVIREAGNIPSGELYATVCGKINLSTYVQLLTILEEQKLVRIENHLISWIGPNE